MNMGLKARSAGSRGKKSLLAARNASNSRNSKGTYWLKRPVGDGKLARPSKPHLHGPAPATSPVAIMSKTSPSPEREPKKETSVPAYYAEQTDFMVNRAGDLLAYHYGLWGPDTTTDEEALLRAELTLVQGCDLHPGRRVLDAGCGVGGTAIMLAETYGIHVTGLTNCEPHVEVAEEHARRRGVAHLTEFHYGDFMDLPFPDASFSAVLNHNSVCYAADKLAYLRGVNRVLKPGGRWQAVDILTTDALMSETQKAYRTNVEQGWRLPPVASWPELAAVLEEAGFEQMDCQDLSSEVERSTEKIRKQWQLFTFLVPPAGWPSGAILESAEAAVNYSLGLREGVFTYNFLAAKKPD